MLHVAELIRSHRLHYAVNIVPKLLVIDAVHLGDAALDQSFAVRQTDIRRLGIEPFFVVGTVRPLDLPYFWCRIGRIIGIDTCHFSINCAEVNANIFILERKPFFKVFQLQGNEFVI